MKEPAVITELLEEMWNSGNGHIHKRDQISAWRKLFRKYHFVPRRYLAVIWLGNGHAYVESESRAGQMHSVDLLEHGCSCENKQIAKSPKCKHEKLVERLIAEEILPAPKPQ